MPYAVPLGVHRNGVLWFNKAIFDEHGLTAPTTWDEFFAAADTLKAAGVTPLALGDKDGWTALNLFEQILLSQLGPEDYRGIWAGTVPWTDERVTAALETFGRVLDYVNEDHSTLTLGPGLADARRRQGGHERHGRLGQGLLHEQRLDARTWTSAGRPCPAPTAPSPS